MRIVWHIDGYLFLLSWLVLLSACQTTSSEPTIEKKSSASAFAENGSDPLDSSVLSDSDTTSPIIENEYDGDIEGYCLDDIYYTYLRDRALSSNTLQPQPNLSQRNRMKLERKRQLNAMHVALTVMNGRTPSLFGGIPVVSSPQIDKWVHYFKTRGRTDFLKWLVRAQTYRDMVLPILEKEGLPAEIFYLAMIESGFSNTAKSRARAIGTWQFMQGTAKLYGLRVDRWIDERRDPAKSTLAAARYLRDLYVQFGDWHLAIAAYNAGPGKIRHSIRKAGVRDFWVIANGSILKQETKDYIPKLLASLIVTSDPEHFGFNIRNLSAETFPTSFVHLTKSYQLDEIAKRLGTSVADIKKWNPEILRSVTPPVTKVDGFYKLRLPETIAAKFPNAEPFLTATKISDMIEYVIRKGDTIERISHRFGVSNSKILAVNPEVNPRRLRPSHVIYVPLGDENEVATAR